MCTNEDKYSCMKRATMALILSEKEGFLASLQLQAASSSSCSFRPAAISVSDLPSHINTTSRPSWHQHQQHPRQRRAKSQRTHGRESSQTQQSLLKIDETHLQRPQKMSAVTHHEALLSRSGELQRPFHKNALKGLFFNS